MTDRNRIYLWILLLVPTVFLLAVLGFPLFYFLWGSVWTETPGFGGEFTLSGYETILTDPAVRATLLNTTILAVVGTGIALLVGFAGVLYSLKLDVSGRLRKMVSGILVVQFLFPGFVLGLAWEFYLGSQGPINRALVALPGIDAPIVGAHNIWAIAFVFGTHYAGLVYLLTNGAVKSIPREMEEVGLVSGASPSTVVARIDFQLVLPSFLIAGAIVLVRAIQSFDLPLLLGLQNNVYTLQTLLYFEMSDYPRNFTVIASLGVIILALSVWLLLVQRRLSGASERYETIEGAGEDTGTLRFGESRALTVGFPVFVAFAYVGPIAMIVLGSLQKAWVGLRLQFVTWSLEGYRVLLAGPRSDLFYRSVTNAITLGVATALIALVLAVIISYLVLKTDWRASVLPNGLAYAAIAIPGLVIASAIQWIILEYNELFGFLYGSLLVLVIAYAANFLVYAVRATNSSFRAIGSSLEEAARVSGAGPGTTIREIYAPLLKPGLLSGFIIILIGTTKSLSLPLILGGNRVKIVQNTIWFLITDNELNVAAAYTVILAFALTVVFAVAYAFDIEMARL